MRAYAVDGERKKIASVINSAALLWLSGCNANPSLFTRGERGALSDGSSSRWANTQREADVVETDTFFYAGRLKDSTK